MSSWNCLVRVNQTTKKSKICLSKATNLQELVTKWDFHHKLIHLTVWDIANKKVRNEYYKYKKSLM